MALDVLAFNDALVGLEDPTEIACSVTLLDLRNRLWTHNMRSAYNVL